MGVQSVQKEKSATNIFTLRENDVYSSDLLPRKEIEDKKNNNKLQQAEKKKIELSCKMCTAGDCRVRKEKMVPGIYLQEYNYTESYFQWLILIAKERKWYRGDETMALN